MNQALDILQEECAEVISVCSKIKRFGIDSSWDDVSNRDKLIQELGDVTCMINIVMGHYAIDTGAIDAATVAKRIKLSTWAPDLFK